MTLFLHGLGHFHPENEISNRFLEELDIGTSNEWIVERVGIRAARHRPAEAGRGRIGHRHRGERVDQEAVVVPDLGAGRGAVWTSVRPE